VPTMGKQLRVSAQREPLEGDTPPGDEWDGGQRGECEHAAAEGPQQADKQNAPVRQRPHVVRSLQCGQTWNTAATPRSASLNRSRHQESLAA